MIDIDWGLRFAWGNIRMVGQTRAYPFFLVQLQRYTFWDDQSAVVSIACHRFATTRRYPSTCDSWYTVRHQTAQHSSPFQSLDWSRPPIRPVLRLWITRTLTNSHVTIGLIFLGWSSHQIRKIGIWAWCSAQVNVGQSRDGSKSMNKSHSCLEKGGNSYFKRCPRLRVLLIFFVGSVGSLDMGCVLTGCWWVI